MCEVCSDNGLPAGWEPIETNPPKRDGNLRLLMKDDSTLEAAVVNGVVVGNDSAEIPLEQIKGWRRRA